jgi:hypothetical protein
LTWWLFYAACGAVTLVFALRFFAEHFPNMVEASESDSRKLAVVVFVQCFGLAAVWPVTWLAWTFLRVRGRVRIGEREEPPARWPVAPSRTEFDACYQQSWRVVSEAVGREFEESGAPACAVATALVGLAWSYVHQEGRLHGVEPDEATAFFRRMVVGVELTGVPVDERLCPRCGGAANGCPECS